MLKTDSFINTMESKATSIQKNISLKSVEEYSFFLPPTIQEQQKIAEFLSTIDELETTLKNQLEQVELMKKYYLEKLFPKKDADIPNLRFEYFKSES
jgi:type I restriction enzyme S subunit